MSTQDDSGAPRPSIARRRAAVVGTARNCANHLPGVLANLARLAAVYDDAYFVFAVSDSRDNSVTLLEEWLTQGRAGKVLDLGDMEHRLPMRTVRLAAARNACLDEIRRHCPDYDHLLVVDLDDVLEKPLDGNAFRRAASWLDSNPDCTALFANAFPRYYDIWALRHPSWCPGDCWHPIWERPPDRPFEAAKIEQVFVRQIVLPPDLPPVPVRSAFGGLGLYRLSEALKASYRGEDDAGRPVSEHVAFNGALADAGGRLFIFPALMVQAPSEHLYRPRDFKFRWRLQMLLRRLAEWQKPVWRTLVNEAARLP